jgi:uncharacterized protein (DUF58 family)
MPFMLVLFGLAIVLRINFFFTVVYFLVATYILVRLWSSRAVNSLRVGRQFNERAFTGDEVPVRLTVHNRGLLPVPWLELSESVPLPLQSGRFQRQALSLGAHEEWHHTYKLGCRRRGYYHVGPLTVQTGDLLGLEGRAQLRVEASPMIVYPRVVPLTDLGLPTRSPLVALPAKSPLFEDPSRLMGVRDYRRGDSPRRIHWPATARTGALVVKQYQPAIARETLICLDMHDEGYTPRRRYEATELAIIAAASIASHIVLREGLAVGLATEAFDPIPEQRRHISLPPRTERAHLMASVLETLARVQLAPDAPITRWLRAESARISWGATMVVITGCESEELYDALLALQRGGRSPALVLIHPEPTPPALQGRAEALGIRVHRVRIERDLETWR